MPEPGEGAGKPRRIDRTREHRMGSPGSGQQFEGSDLGCGAGLLEPIRWSIPLCV